MKLTPNDISEIQDAGMLDGNPVKMIRTTGGFWIATGKPRGNYKDQALAAGSHPAIVRYNLEKQYPSFQPSMMKSELLSDSAVVDKHSHFLSEELLKSGHDIYSVQEEDFVKFHITKHDVEIASAQATLDKDFLTINSLSVPQKFAKGMAGATLEKAMDCKVGLKLKKQ